MDSSIGDITDPVSDDVSTTVVGDAWDERADTETTLEQSIGGLGWEPRPSLGTPVHEHFAAQVAGLVSGWVALPSAPRHRRAAIESVSAARAAQVLAALPSQQSRHRDL